MVFSSLVSAPADSTTYFFGSPGFSVGTTQGFYRIRIPRAGTIKKVTFESYYSGTQPTSETSTLNLRINSGADVLLDSGFHNESNGAGRIISTTIAVAADDYLEFNWQTPAWATNPGTSITIKTFLYIE
jgi:hypothetical protein